MIFKQAGASMEERPVIDAALAVAEETASPARPSSCGRADHYRQNFGAAWRLAAALLNALKALGGIEDEVHLIAPSLIEPIQDLKVNHLGNHNPSCTWTRCSSPFRCAHHRPQGRDRHAADRKIAGFGCALYGHPFGGGQLDLPQAGHGPYLRAGVPDQKALPQGVRAAERTEGELPQHRLPPCFAGFSPFAWPPRFKRQKTPPRARGRFCAAGPFGMENGPPKRRRGA